MARKDIIIMREKEVRRQSIVDKVINKELTQIAAAELMGICERQTRRIIARVKKEGVAGLAHKSRGRKSNRAYSEAKKKKVIDLYRKKYEGFGPTLASEKLGELEKINIHAETLRLWLKKSGDWKEKRKRRAHRKWRERKACRGEMVQMDGSHHDWFEGRGKKCVLMGYIDDATGDVFARFYDHEGTMPAMDSLHGYIKRKGIPQSLYLDKHTTYKSNGKLTLEDELAGRECLSQFERACKEIAINIIHANSPQAKGRIERLFRTFQDRLIKEMRLENISSIEEANVFLKAYLPKYNRRFKVKSLNAANLHRKPEKNVQLKAVLCIKTDRTLKNDNTISYNTKLYQIMGKINGKKVCVQDRIDGQLVFSFKGKKLSYKEIEYSKRNVRKTHKTTKARNKPPIPQSNHSWRAWSPKRLVA